MKSFFFLITALLCSFELHAQKVFENELQPFTTDGCSVVGPAVSQFNPDITKCCIAHDIAYWKGGESSLRLNSDKELKSCIAKVSNIAVGEVFYRGVRIGGRPDTTNTFRWGYGWIHQRSYRPVSSKELDMIERLAPVDYFETPITEPVENLFAIPTVSGNYCKDSMNIYLKNFYGDREFNVESSITKVGRHTTSVRLNILNENKYFLFQFKTYTWKTCERDRFHEVLPQLFKKVLVLKR